MVIGKAQDTYTHDAVFTYDVRSRSSKPPKPTPTGETDVVIAKAPEGSKYEAAVKWNTVVASLPWLHACEKERGELKGDRELDEAERQCVLIGLHRICHRLLTHPSLTYTVFLSSLPPCTRCTVAVYVEPRKFLVKPPSHSPPPLRYDTHVCPYIYTYTHATNTISVQHRQPNHQQNPQRR